MKELVLQKGTFIVVPIDCRVRADNFKIHPSFKFNGIDLLNSTITFGEMGFEHLDGYGPAELELIGLVSEILKDEDKAKMVVDVEPKIFGDGYTNYMENQFLFKKATDSLLNPYALSMN